MKADTASSPLDRLADPSMRTTLSDARKGSAESLGRLLNEFRPYLLTIADEELPPRLGQKLGRSDLVQDVIIKGYQSFATFGGNSREELAGWLRKILLNHLANVVDAYQTEKRDIARERPVDRRIIAKQEPTPSHIVLEGEERTRLDRSLSRLPEELRQVLLLRHRDNLSFSDLGIRFSCSESGARKLWARAIRALRKELKMPETIVS